MDGIGFGGFWWAGLIAMGLGVGFLAGLFGVGGGFLLTPLLAVLFRLPMDIAIGTGLCQMIGTATAARIRFARLGQGEPKLAWMMGLGSLLGVGLGARTVQALGAMDALWVMGVSLPADRFWLSLGYVLLLGGVAAWMGYDTRRSSLPIPLHPDPGALARLRIPPYTGLPHTGHTVSIPVVAYMGLVVGYLSGLLGIGGGVILVPLLIYGIGMRIRTAASTGVGVLLITSLLGTLVHARLGNVHLGIALTLLIGSTLGAQSGAIVATRTEGRKLRGWFAGLVALTALLVAGDLIRQLIR